MQSCSKYVWALCLLASFVLFPAAVFAQSTGTFTVNKSYADSETGEVDVTLICSNGYGPVEQTTVGLTTTFNIGGNVIATDWIGIELYTTCTATETPVPTGYDSDEAVSCPAATLDEDIPGDGGTASGSCTVTNTPDCGDGEVTVDEQCDLGIGNGAPQGSCCTALCTFVDVGTECNASDGVCDLAEVCDGSTAECPADGDNSTDVCNPSLGACDPAEYCDGISDDCPVDDFYAVGTGCRADVSECDIAEECTGTSADCPTDGFDAYGTLCGDVPEFQCDAQDICEGSTSECILNPDPLAACGVVGKGDGCELNVCDGEGPSDFRLLFTPDLPNWVSYKLNASNPGQLFYTLVSEPDVPNDANLLLQIPFPFVTQGNMTLHVFDADDAYTEDSCLLIGELAESTPYPVEITMDSYWGAASPCTEPIGFPEEAGAYCKHITGPNPEDFEILCPDDYNPNGGDLVAPALALQECWAYVPVELENYGQFVARLHLDYGLKGKWLDEYCPADGNIDRYAPGGKGDYGDFDALGIDVDANPLYNSWLSECNIPTCQPYTFAHGGLEPGPVAAGCCDPTGETGLACGDSECVDTVCAIDDYCCTGWDGICGGEAVALCSICEEVPASDCFTNNVPDPGCDDEACEATVCGADAYCCDTEWDDICVSEAHAWCGDPVDNKVESEIESVNYFKKPVGIFGRAECSDSNDPLLGDGFAGLTVKLYKSTGGSKLAQATTDADGYYFLNYKHKGKAVYYNVELWNGGTLLAQTSGTGNPGDVPLQANGFAEQNFFDTGAYICSTANDDGWEAGEYSITKGKFKTIQ